MGAFYDLVHSKRITKLSTANERHWSNILNVYRKYGFYLVKNNFNEGYY